MEKLEKDLDRPVRNSLPDRIGRSGPVTALSDIIIFTLSVSKWMGAVLWNYDVGTFD